MLACELHIAPEDLAATRPSLLAAMLAYLEDRAREQRRQETQERLRAGLRHGA